MTTVLVDSNILLDLMTEDPRWYSWSASAVESEANTFRLVNAIIYAEVSEPVLERCRNGTAGLTAALGGEQPVCLRSAGERSGRSADDLGWPKNEPAAREGCGLLMDE